ncbi:hypothetical protein GCM10020254_24300 [Streptomyces goshikiensis]
MVPVDRLEVHGLALPGRPAHGVDGDPVVDPGGGVPGEEVVGQRPDQEVVRLHGVEADRHRLRVPRQVLPLGHPADQGLGEVGRGQCVEHGAQVVGGERPVLLLVEHPVQDEVSRLRDVEGLGEQVAEEVHFHAPVAQYVRESVVLLAGPADPQHVVEEEGVLIGWCEPLQLQIGPVEDDAAQPPGLGVDMESHAVHVPRPDGF